jgi:N-acylglucosamine 2-epimerase
MPHTFAERYRKELIESVVPFWLKYSLDHRHGGYLTCLDHDGSVYDTKKYVWLQGRAVWMFSRLYNELERRQEYLDAATLGLEFMRRHARDPQGRVYFSLTREGEPYFYQRKPYAAVFYQMGLLEYARATGRSDCFDEAVELFWRIVDWVKHPEALGRPIEPGQALVSKLADLLVTGVLAAELARQFDDPRYRQVIRETIDGVARHYDPRRRLFLEHVARDGRDLSQSPEGRLFSPGHSIETAWILLDLLRFFPDPMLHQLALDAIAGSLDFGWDREYGGLYYLMDISGRPTLQIEATMKLWWAHAEAIYALVLAYTHTRDPRWLEWLEQIDAYTFDHFVDPVHGEWFGYCDRRGDLVLTCKGGSYKGFFHVPRALLFSVQCIEQARGRPGVEQRP